MTEIAVAETYEGFSGVPVVHVSQNKWDDQPLVIRTREQLNDLVDALLVTSGHLRS